MPHASYLLKNVSPHAPLPAHPLKSTVSYDYLSAADEVCIKRWLSNRLRDLDPRNVLPNMPGGFPFHYAVDGRGRGSLSYEPYKFCEEVPSNMLAMGGPPRRYWVTFSFTGEKSSGHRVSPSYKPRRYMTWRAYITLRDISYYHCELLNFPLLHVELDPALLGTSYGHLFTSAPSVVLRAMGVSLDKGLPITIKLGQSSEPREILFFSTEKTGERHLLHKSKLRL
ncbi:hypothetical protein C8R43DRAFT_1139592 [Mycena crocata]|nr:hypothetical protein C8R43DRAFT_1139592 [Mycena crocata]